MRGLGVATTDKEVFLFYESGRNDFCVATSKDGSRFRPSHKKLVFVGKGGKPKIPSRAHAFRIAKAKGKHALLYAYKPGRAVYRALATSANLFRWRKIGNLSLKETGAIVGGYVHKRQAVMYVGGKDIRVGFSENLASWKVWKVPLLTPRRGFFDRGAFEVASAFLLSQGILVLYFVKTKTRGRARYVLGGALFDRTNPRNLIWRSDVPLWEESEELEGNKRIAPVGALLFHGMVRLYWETKSGAILSVAAPLPPLLGEGQGTPIALTKFVKNPIIAPRRTHAWESQATFNPAALYEGGKVHLLYRAIGDEGLSVLGYAASRDGFHVDERLSEPAFVPAEPFDRMRMRSPHAHRYMSGGGWGGSEDPRLTRIGNRVYMTYVAFDGWNPPRVALTSINLSDFLEKRWHWSPPVLISPPGVIDKNACILPETVRGKYVIFHRIFPNIQIDFVSDLNFDGTTRWLKREGDAVIRPRKAFWDSRKIGAGAPPLKTSKGWLLIYQGVDDRNDSEYKIGAMLLDLEDPTRVIARAKRPILEPRERYENEGYKHGVAYPCGAAVIGGTLFVYYGGADMVTCVATAPFNDFVETLASREEAALTPVAVF